MSGFVAAQDASVRKEVEALYTKRDEAIKGKDVAAFRSTQTKDFEYVFAGSTSTGEEAMSKAEEILKRAKEVKSFATHIESTKRRK